MTDDAGAFGADPDAEGRRRGRIFFVATTLRGGGAEAVGIAWMTWFAAQGYDVTAVLASPTADVAALPADVTVVRLGHLRHAAKVAALRRGMRIRRPDAVVALQTYPNLIAIAAGAGLPDTERPVIVATEHNLISLGLPGASLSHRAKIALAKSVYRFADIVTSASHPVAAEMSAAFGVRPSRSLVVPNPALARLTPGPTVTRAPGIDRGLQLVLACRLVEQKSPHLAIEAARVLTRRGIDTTVVSFGGGPLESELTDLATRLGVDFSSRGWVDDWFSHFADNSVVLLPSHREGFGNVLVEAAARGVPSVAVSPALGVADAIIPGVTGELAFDADPESIADAVIAASAIEIDDIDTWLDRFSVHSSGELLEEAIRYGRGLRSA